MKSLQNIALPARREQGFALVTVLLVSMVITLVAVAFTQQSRQRINAAQALEDRLQAELAAYSTLQNAVFELKTRPMSATHLQTRDSDGQSSPRDWNLFGEPQTLTAPNGEEAQSGHTDSDVELRIQDGAGLVPLLFSPSRRLIDAAMQAIGADAQQRARFYDSLLDWMDEDDLRRLQGAESDYYRQRDKPEPRNHFIQIPHEIQLVRGMSEQDYAAISEHVTLQPAGHFNPASAPRALLEALYGEDTATQIERLRSEEQASSAAYFRLAGIQEDSETMVMPGNQFRISATASVAQSQVTRSALVSLRSTDQRPFTWQQWYRQ